jgi:hypothetical protein
MNGQSTETGNIGYTRQRQTKLKHNTICDDETAHNIHVHKFYLQSYKRDEQILDTILSML